MPTLVILTDGTIPVAEDFNGNWRRQNQAIGVNTAITNYAPGDMLYSNATDTLTRLPIGNPGDVLTASGGIPAWSSSGAVSGTWQQRGLQGTLSTSALTVAADSVMLRNAGLAIKVHESVSAITIDPTVVGLNGRDQTAAFTAPIDLYAYWISNGVFARGVWADSAPPTGPDLTTLSAFAGYTYWCYIGAYRYLAGPTFTAATQRGRTIFYDGAQNVIADGQALTETAVSVAAFVPAAALTWTAYLTGYHRAATNQTPRFRVRTGVDYDVPGVTGDTPFTGMREEVTWPNVGQQYYYLYGAAPGATLGHYGYVRAYTVGNGGD